MTEQIEQRARAMWSSRLIQADIAEIAHKRPRAMWSGRLIQVDIAKIAHKYGFAKAEIISLDWDLLPETIQDHFREIAKKEIESGE
jgi:hypothetical protein